MGRQKTETKNFLTPGTISAFPSSLHSATLALICSRTSPFISPVSPEGDTANVKMNFTRTWIMQVIHKTVGNDLEFCYSSRKPWWSGRSLVTSKFMVLFLIALFHLPTKKKKKKNILLLETLVEINCRQHMYKTKQKAKMYKSYCTYLRKEPGIPVFCYWWHQFHVKWPCEQLLFSFVSHPQDTGQTWSETEQSSTVYMVPVMHKLLYTSVKPLITTT